VWRRRSTTLSQALTTARKAWFAPATENANALRAFFTKAKIYDNLENAFAESKLDITLVLSPAHLHFEHVVQALRNYSHVLCEKPMALSADDCARMNAVATETDHILAIGMIRRFFPAYQQFKQMMCDGKLGSLVSFEYREGHKFEWDVTTSVAFRPRMCGGTGVLFDIGPHVVDYLTWLFGDLKVPAYADDAISGIESNVSLEIESHFCRGSIHLSWDCPQSNELRVLGSKGEAVLRVDRFDQLAVRTTSDYELQKIPISFPTDTLRQAQSYMSPKSYVEAIYCQLVQMMRAIKWGEPPAVDGLEGEKCIFLLESALSVACPLDMPWLERSEEEAFRRMHWKNNS
jgi:predicted dehydrogenase